MIYSSGKNDGWFLKKLIVVAAIALVAGAAVPSSGAYQLMHGMDSVFLDSAGNEILCQGGDIRKYGDTYYWYGMRVTGTSNSGTYIYTSKDLAKWKLVGNSGAHMGWRANILYNDSTKQYVLITGTGMNFATGSSPSGPFTSVGSKVTVPNDQGGGDIGVFQDEDKNAYVIYATWPGSSQNTDVGIARLTRDYLHLDSVVCPFTGTHCEAPYILKRHGIYFLFTSSCAGWNSTATSYITATNLKGPWSSEKTVSTTPSTSDSYNSQHDFDVMCAGPTDTAYVYFGDRYSEYTSTGVGKNVIIPLTFTGDVPQLHGLTTWYLDVTLGKWSATAVSVDNKNFAREKARTDELRYEAGKFSITIGNISGTISIYSLSGQKLIVRDAVHHSSIDVRQLRRGTYVAAIDHREVVFVR
jgi:hypothetical protein